MSFYVYFIAFLPYDVSLGFSHKDISVACICLVNKHLKRRFLRFCFDLNLSFTFLFSILWITVGDIRRET